MNVPRRCLLLAAMMVVALIDWFFVLPDWLR
jgi:hypothetical protein